MKRCLILSLLLSGIALMNVAHAAPTKVSTATEKIVQDNGTNNASNTIEMATLSTYVCFEATSDIFIQKPVPLTLGKVIKMPTETLVPPDSCS